MLPILHRNPPFKILIEIEIFTQRLQACEAFHLISLWVRLIIAWYTVNYLHFLCTSMVDFLQWQGQISLYCLVLFLSTSTIETTKTHTHVSIYSVIELYKHSTDGADVKYIAPVNAIWWRQTYSVFAVCYELHCKFSFWLQAETTTHHSE